MKIEVESEALDTLKAMAQRLQQERDELLDTLKLMKFDIEQNIQYYDELSSYRLSQRAIAKCTAEQPVSDWQERMK